MVLTDSRRLSRIRRYSGARAEISTFRVRGCYPLWPTFPGSSAKHRFCNSVKVTGSFSLVPQPRAGNAQCFNTSSVWALPVSLAATQGIDYSFSSSGYLDVSVPRVVFFKLCIHLKITGHDSGWVAPFGYPRIEACLRLPVAFRC